MRNENKPLDLCISKKMVLLKFNFCSMVGKEELDYSGVRSDADKMGVITSI